MGKIINLNLFLTILFVVYCFSFSVCQEKYTASFSTKRKSIEIYISNNSGDTLSLPSQAYSKVLPDNSYEFRSDSLIIILKSQEATFGSIVENKEKVYFSDYDIWPYHNNIFEFALPRERMKIKKIKRRCIKWVVIEWSEGRIVCRKE